MKISLILIFFLFIFAIFLSTQPSWADSIERVGACDTPGYADGVYVQGQHAYIADRDGVTSIDINNPSNPQVLDYYNQPPSGATSLFVRDTLAYVNSALGGPALTIINIVKPESLKEISWVEVPGYGGAEPKGIYISDSLAYFADSDGGFLIIDISNLLNPTILCTLETQGNVIDLYVRDTLAYLADQDSLLIVNVSNPYFPIIIGHIDISGDGAYDVWVSGNYAFVTEEDWWNGQGKINMIDISDPTSPILRKQIDIAGTPYGLFVVNDKIYVAADDWWAARREKGKGKADIEGGIRVIHWEAPDSMNLLVSFDTPGRCRDIFVVDSFIYVAVVDSFMIYKYVNTDIEEENTNPKGQIAFLQVFPNPFTSEVSVKCTGITEGQKANLQIYDVSGRLVKSVPITTNHLVLGANLFPGVYFLKLKTDASSITSKLIKLK